MNSRRAQEMLAAMESAGPRTVFERAIMEMMRARVRATVRQRASRKKKKEEAVKT